MAPKRKKAAKSATSRRKTTAGSRNPKMKISEQSKTGAFEPGFKNIDRTPSVPPFLPGHLVDWKRPEFPTDQSSRDVLTKLFEDKLRLVRENAKIEINALDDETKEDLLKRKPTSENPVAKLLSDPKMPMPIAFQAQDLVRMYLYEIITILDFDTNSPDERTTNKWKRDWDAANTQKATRWNALVKILQLQLPGEEAERTEQVAQIMHRVLQDEVEFGDD